MTSHILRLHANTSRLEPLLDEAASRLRALSLPEEVFEAVVADLVEFLRAQISVVDDRSALGAGEVCFVFEFAVGTTEAVRAALAALDAEGVVGWRHVIEASFVSVDGDSQGSTGEASSKCDEVVVIGVDVQADAVTVALGEMIVGAFEGDDFTVLTEAQWSAIVAERRRVGRILSDAEMRAFIRDVQ